MEIRAQQWKKITAVNVGAAIGAIGALFVLPATAVGIPLLLTSVGFWGLVNFIAIPRILRNTTAPGQAAKKLRWQTIVMWVCIILGLVFVYSAHR